MQFQITVNALNYIWKDCTDISVTWSSGLAVGWSTVDTAAHPDCPLSRLTMQALVRQTYSEQQRSSLSGCRRNTQCWAAHEVQYGKSTENIKFTVRFKTDYTLFVFLPAEQDDWIDTLPVKIAAQPLFSPSLTGATSQSQNSPRLSDPQTNKYIRVSSFTLINIHDSQLLMDFQG